MTSAREVALPGDRLGSWETKGNCQIATCSLYLSRAETRFLADHGVKAAMTSLRIPEANPFLAIAGEVATQRAREAIRNNQCLRIRTVPTAPPAAVGLYSDGGKYCKD